jgi:ribosomal protein S18 acetylase RimI-like enzyme
VTRGPSRELSGDPPGFRLRVCVLDIRFRWRFRTDDDARMTVDITAATIPTEDELVSLYDAVGWATYARDSATLHRAMQGSSRVATARRDGQLLGLARVISDGATIAYLQDVVVRPAEQRRGLGKRLVEEAFAPFESVRQKVLLTDDEPGQRAFYESLGFAETRDFDDGSLRAFVKFG